MKVYRLPARFGPVHQRRESGTVPQVCARSVSGWSHSADAQLVQVPGTCRGKL